MEKTETDRRFRNRVLAGILILFVAYLSYKIHLISIAFDRWNMQDIEIPTHNAAN